MSIFAIVFGSLLGVFGFAGLIASIALNGTGGSYILSLFFMGLGVPLIFMGVRRLKQKQATPRNTQAASNKTATTAAVCERIPAPGESAASGQMKENPSMRDIVVPALEQRLNVLAENKPLICAKCQNALLRKDEFAAELQKMGLRLAPDGRNISFSGVVSSYDALEDIQGRAAKLEGRKAIQCVSCGRVYCVDCLARFAPMHPSTGGKACFFCRGTLKEI